MSAWEQALFCATTVWTTILIVFLLSPGRLYVVMPVTFSKKVSSTHWKACIDPEGLNLQNPSIFISTPASASVGCYRFQVCVFTKDNQKSRTFGKFILLCNPWCRGEYRSTQWIDQNFFSWNPYKVFSDSRGFGSSLYCSSGEITKPEMYL